MTKREHIVTQSASSSLFFQLPEELIVEIFNRIIEPKAFLSLSKTCLVFSRISLDNRVQAKAKERLKRLIILENKKKPL